LKIVEKEGKMEKEIILANIYLHSILPLLEDIVEVDKEAQNLIKDWNCSIQFDVSGGPKASLIFKDGKLKAKREKIANPTIAFWFPNVVSLNKMFGEKKVIPPWKGFWHIGILKKFDRLTSKIESYLKPEEEFLKIEENLRFNLKLTLNTLIWSIKAVGENSKDFKVQRAMKVISKFQNKAFQVEILPDGPFAHILIGDGKLFPAKEKHSSPSAILQVRDINVAKKMFAEELDFMVALGTGELKIIGLIPFAEAISIIMEELPKYLPK
jgi:hypothetical protein